MRTPRFRTLQLGMSVFCSLVGSIGCAAKTAEIQDGASPGYIVLLPGVEGGVWQLRGVREGLRDAGIDWTIEIIPWGTPPLHSLSNLTDLPENLRRADRIAARLTELRREAPKGPLVLIGYSGGGGLALLTLNALTPEIKVDRVVLVAAAISNSYDLTVAKGHCTDRIINIYSPRDGIVGWGTSWLGTIDRVKTVSAGHSGFVEPDGTLREDPMLKQVQWCAEWEKYGHSGGHVCYLYRAWARHVLAPLVNPDVPADRIAAGR